MIEPLSSELVVSTVTFVLSSALLTSFVIPQVQKLKEIKDRLFQFQLTNVPSQGIYHEIQSARAQSEADAAEMQNILDTYAVRAQELQATVQKFYWSIILAIATIFLRAIFPSWKNVFLTSHPILQLALLIWAIKTYATDPDTLSSAICLVRDCQIHPHSLVNAMELELSLGSDGGFFDRITKETPLAYSIIPKMRVYGFRFLVVVADKSNKVYYTAFGPVTSKIPLWRHFVHPTWGIAEMNRIPVGHFRLNKTPDPQALQAWFLVFLPFFKHETLNPMIGYTNYSAPGLGKESVLSYAGHIGPLKSGNTYGGIAFSGEGAKLLDLKVDAKSPDQIEAITKVVSKFRSDFISTQEIREYEDLSGSLI